MVVVTRATSVKINIHNVDKINDWWALTTALKRLLWSWVINDNISEV